MNKWCGAEWTVRLPPQLIRATAAASSTMQLACTEISPLPTTGSFFLTQGRFPLGSGGRRAVRKVITASSGVTPAHRSFRWEAFFPQNTGKWSRNHVKLQKKKHFVVAVCYSRCLHMVSFGCFFFPCFFFSSSVGKSCRHWRCLLNVFQRVE